MVVFRFESSQFNFEKLEELDVSENEIRIIKKKPLKNLLALNMAGNRLKASFFLRLRGSWAMMATIAATSQNFTKNIGIAFFVLFLGLERTRSTKTARAEHRQQ